MLQFSDTSTKNGIIQRLEYETGLGDAKISGNATLFAQQTAIINKYASRATMLIITASGTWSWDDTSHTDQAVATTTLTADKGDYTILENTPEAAKDYLRPRRVEIKNSAGDSVRLRGKNLRRYSGSITEQRTTTGTPISYDFNGTSIFLDPIPNYTVAKGLKIWFDRAQLNFAVADTTKRPGFNSIFHEYLVLGPLLDWQLKNIPGKAASTKVLLDQMESEMQGWYGMRDDTEPNKLQRPAKSYK